MSFCLSRGGGGGGEEGRGGEKTVKFTPSVTTKVLFFSYHVAHQEEEREKNKKRLFEDLRRKGRVASRIGPTEPEAWRIRTLSRHTHAHTTQLATWIELCLHNKSKQQQQHQLAFHDLSNKKVSFVVTLRLLGNGSPPPQKKKLKSIFWGSQTCIFFLSRDCESLQLVI